jgi:alpha-2-macroglobulin
VEGFDYLTVYVGHFLTDCKSSGIHVPARLYQATLRRLRYMADAKVANPTIHNGITYYWRTRWEAEMRASAIYLLTRNEEVTTNYALKLQDFLEAKVPKELWHRDSTAAWLAATWRLLKKESAAAPLIKAHRAALKKPLPKRWEYGYYYYNSRLTGEATTFTVLCRHFPEIAAKLTYDDLKPLTGMIESADFHTLSAAWSVQALKAYCGTHQEQRRESGHRHGAGEEVEVLAEPATGQLQVKVPEGMVRFFFAEGSPEGLGRVVSDDREGLCEDPAGSGRGNHIEVLRELVDANGQTVTQSKLGETLFAKLTIRNLTKTDMPNLAITEMLPGGFELAPPGEPESLRPGLATRQGTDYIDVSEDRALIYLGLRGEGSLSLKYACARPARAPSWFRHPMPKTCMRPRSGQTARPGNSSSWLAIDSIGFHVIRWFQTEGHCASAHSSGRVPALLLALGYAFCQSRTCCLRTWNIRARCWTAMAMWSF